MLNSGVPNAYPSKYDVKSGLNKLCFLCEKSLMNDARYMLNIDP